MSNKTILQTNNTNLASYTDRVTALINTANSLPEAGGTAEDLEAELTAQETLITNITTALANKASGGSGGGSIEWQDVFALPETYAVHGGLNFYYIERPDNLKAVSLRCSSISRYGSASAIVMNDGSNISFTSEEIACSISILNEENVIKIGVDPYYFTTAEYLIV